MRWRPPRKWRRSPLNSASELPRPGGAHSAGGGHVGAAAALRRGAARVTPLLLLLPAAALLAWLLVYPLVDAVRLSFTDWNGLSEPHSVGFANYDELLHDNHLKEALLHNLAILAALPIWIGLPYGIAWALHHKIRGWQFFRFAFFLPVVLSPVVIGVCYGIVLKPNGPFNELLRAAGLGELVHEWLNDPTITLPLVIGVIIWSTFGIGVLIFLSAFSNLDTEQIDAARVDGAAPWQIQRHVVFWQILPVIEFWTILILIASLTGVFPLIYTLTHGGPGHSTYTVDFDLYQEAFAAGRFGYASAIGVCLVIVIGVIGGVFLAVLRWRRRAA